MKRCNGSNKGTQCFKFTPVGRLYKQERMVKKKVSLQSRSEDQKQKQSPRRKNEDTYAVRVEGRSKEGFISFTK
jgi:ribosomal protein S30